MCVLPFPQAEFEKDFARRTLWKTGSLSRFQRLCDKATTRFELDGTRAEESAAYGEGGLVVLNQSDLLIVVWDGERHGKRGGTEETFGEARSRGVTVAWIDARAPQNWQLLDAATPLPRRRRRTARRARWLWLRGRGWRKLVREVLELPKPVEASDQEGIASKRREPQKRSTRGPA